MRMGGWAAAIQDASVIVRNCQPHGHGLQARHNKIQYLANSCHGGWYLHTTDTSLDHWKALVFSDWGWLLH